MASTREGRESLASGKVLASRRRRHDEIRHGVCSATANATHPRGGAPYRHRSSWRGVAVAYQREDRQDSGNEQKRADAPERHVSEHEQPGRRRGQRAPPHPRPR